MLAKLLLLSVLFFLSHQLRNQTSSSSAFPLIANAYFERGEVFFLTKDRRGFGHIQKENGDFLLNWLLDSEERILYESEYQVFVSHNQSLFQYSVLEKTVRTLGSLRTGNVSDYEGYQVFKFGFYVFADGELSLNEWKTHEEGEEIISLQIDQDEQFKQMETFDQKLLLFTTTANTLCFTQVDRLTVSGKKCITRISPNDVAIQVSGRYVYVTYSGNKLQVLDKDFTVVQNFQEPVLQLSKGSASFAGFKTFDIQSKTWKEWKLVAHNHEGNSNSLSSVSGQYILREGEEEVAKIPNIASEPVGLWLNKKDAGVGRIQGKYELLAQFSNGSLSLYEIRASEGTNSTVVLQWSH